MLAFPNLEVLEEDVPAIERELQRLKELGVLHLVPNKFLHVIANGGVEVQKKLAMKAVLSVLIENMRTDALRLLATSQATLQLSRLETPLTIPSSREELEAVLGAIRKLQRHDKSIAPNREAEFNRQQLLEQLGDMREAVFASLSESERTTLTTPLPLDATKTDRRQLVQATERATGRAAMLMMKVEEVNAAIVRCLEHNASAIGQLTGNMAELFMFGVDENTSAEDLTRVIEMTATFEAAAEQAQRTAAITAPRDTLLAEYPLAALTLKGFDKVIATGTAAELLEAVCAHHDTTEHRALPLLIKYLQAERTHRAFATAQAAAEQAQEEADRQAHAQLAAAEEMHQQLNEQYGQCVPGMRTRTNDETRRKSLMELGPAAMVEQLIQEGMSPTAAITWVVNTLTYLRKDFFPDYEDGLLRRAAACGYPVVTVAPVDEDEKSTKTKESQTASSKKQQAGRRARQLARSTAGPAKGNNPQPAKYGQKK